MCSACGARPSGALASSAARWRTPKRCCSSTTHSARSRNSTGSSISAWVPTTSASSPDASRASRSRRRAAGVEPVSSSTGTGAAEQPVEREQVLLGQRLGGRHQRGLAAVLDRAQHRVQRHHGLAAADLPHQQPLHRPLARQVGVDRARSAAAWSPVSSNGSELRHGVHQEPSPGRAARAPPARRGARRGPATASWSRNSSSNASRRARPGLLVLGVGEVGAPPGPPGGRPGARPRAAPRAAARPRGGSGRSPPTPACAAWPPRCPAVAGCTGTRPTVCTGAAPWPTSSCSVTQNSLRRRSLPCSSTCVPSAELARDPGLVEPHRQHRAGLVEDARLHPLAAPVAHRLDARRSAR